MTLSDQQVLELWQNAKQAGQSQDAFAQTIGVTKKAIECKLWRARKAKKIEPLPQLFRGADFGEPFDLEGDFVIIGDVHAPFTDYDFATLPALIGKKHLRKPRKLIIAGDFFDMGLFSRYDDIVARPAWAYEREACKHLLDQWLQVFDEIYMVMGNHDRRLQKFTAGAFETTDLLAMVYGGSKRVKMSNFGWCTVTSGGVPYRITHPANYSINQLTVASDLANKYQTNIISHHEHHVAKGWDRYKNYVIVNNGGLFDASQFDYVVLDDKRSSGMEQSFVLLKDGYAHLLGNEPFTDWSLWL